MSPVTRPGHVHRRRALFGGIAFAAAVLLSGASGTAPGDAEIAEAVMRGDTAQLRALIKQGADVNEAQADGMTALHWAASRGDVSATKMLLFAGARVDVLTRNGSYTPLHLAARGGRAEAVKALLDKGANVNAVTSSGGASALHFASQNGDSSTVSALLEKGATVDAKETAFLQTPLMWAAAFDRVPAIRVLVRKGADIEATSKVEDIGAREKADRAALTVRARKIAAMKAAEAAPVAPNQLVAAPGTSSGPTAVSAPIAGNGAAQAAAQGGASAGPPAVVSAATNVGTTTRPTAADSVRRAAMAGESATSNAGVSASKAETKDGKKPEQSDKANKDDKKSGDRNGNSAKDDRDRKDDGDRKGDRDRKDGGVKAPAAAPVVSDSARRAAAFNRGPSYGDLIGNKGGLTPLLFAVREGHQDAAEELIKLGAEIDHVSAGDHTSPLLMASINGYFDMAKMLLDKGADVKLASDANATPLYAVINIQWAPKSLYPNPTAQLQQQTPYLALMEQMLKAGADPNVRLSKHLWYMSFNFDLLGVNTTGATPFWRAAYGTDVEGMKLLVRYKADPTIPTLKPTGRLPGDDSGGDAAAPGAKDPSGLPPVPDGGPGVYPLHAASGVGYGDGFAANAHRHAPDAWITSMKYLIEELHTDVNQRDFNGQTALHNAAARGDNESIKYLMSKGADISVVSRKGQTVADMANGPVERVPPFLETLDYVVKLGSKNSNKCKSC